jgi:hypothetical protein
MAYAPEQDSGKKAGGGRRFDPGLLEEPRSA